MQLRYLTDSSSSIERRSWSSRLARDTKFHAYQCKDPSRLPRSSTRLPSMDLSVLLDSHWWTLAWSEVTIYFLPKEEPLSRAAMPLVSWSGDSRTYHDLLPWHRSSQSLARELCSSSYDFLVWQETCNADPSHIVPGWRLQDSRKQHGVMLRARLSKELWDYGELESSIAASS